jgi:hypothetical protein
MDRRVRELIDRFEEYIEVFDQASLFTGPSLYFHEQTIKRLRSHDSALPAIKDEAFLESLYATLTAWGMHRMGPGGAKLVDFPNFVEQLQSLAPELGELSDKRLSDIPVEDVANVTQQVWRNIAKLKIATGETRIVVGSKALHHILPELVPPIDREYTLRFFYGHKTLSRGEQSTFMEIFPRFHTVLHSCIDTVQSKLGTGMHTSPTKVLDNAIVGYVRKELRAAAVAREKDQADAETESSLTVVSHTNGRCHEQVLVAARSLTARKGSNEFTADEVLEEMRTAGSRYSASTVRTHVVSRCCANAPNHHAVVYKYFERIRPGLYKIL